jgi:hypothetical protein
MGLEGKRKMDLYTCDIKSEYPHELYPHWWQFKAKAQLKGRARLLHEAIEAQKIQANFMETLKETLRHTNIAMSHNMHVTYAARPPAPRPSQLTIVYEMQDGQQIREYVPMNGNAIWTQAPLDYVYRNPLGPPVKIEYIFGYQDGGMW